MPQNKTPHIGSSITDVPLQDFSNKEILSPFVIIKNISLSPEDIVPSTLSPEEEERLHSINDLERKCQFYWGRYYLRYYLSDLFNVSLKEVPLYTDENGKPYIKGDRYYVSITHCNNKLGIIVSPYACGIDIEKVSPRKKFDLLKERIFSHEDLDFIEKSPSPISEFYKNWTLKEAFFKMGENFQNSITVLRNNKNMMIYSQIIDDYAISYVWCR